MRVIQRSDMMVMEGGGKRGKGREARWSARERARRLRGRERRGSYASANSAPSTASRGCARR
jgi:hypothetical protein